MPQTDKVLRVDLANYLAFYKTHELHPHDCLYNFVSLGEMLKEQFPRASQDKILDNLKKLQMTFDDDAIPVLTATTVAEKISLKFAHPDMVTLKSQYSVDKLPSQELLDNLQLGYQAIKTLIGDRGTKSEIKNDALLGSSMRFLAFDLQHNSEARKLIKKGIRVIKEYAREKYADKDTEKGHIANNLAKDLKILADNYFTNINKTVEKLEEFKVQSNAKLDAAQEKMAVHRATGFTKVLTICKNFFKNAFTKLLSAVKKSKPVHSPDTLFYNPTQGTLNINKAKSAVAKVDPLPPRGNRRR